MPDDDVRALTIIATEAAPLRPHELDLVVSRASGSPLFVGELIAAAQELGSLDAVPESLQGTLAAQVDALDPLSKRMLSYASVLGRSFRRTIVEELLRREGLELDEATIAQLSKFLEADGPLRYRFKNGLVCDVVYDSLAVPIACALHLAAGEAFETLSNGRRHRERRCCRCTSPSPRTPTGHIGTPALQPNAPNGRMRSPRPSSTTSEPSTLPVVQGWGTRTSVDC